MPDHADIARRLDAVDQAHLLRFYDALDAPARRRLLERIDAIELERLPALVERYVRAKPTFTPPADLEPAPFYPADSGSPRRPWDRAAARRAGEAALRAGTIGVFTVAGGQGTRLGFDAPKGCYPGAAVTGKPLFRCVAEWILAAQDRFAARIPWCLMTSPLNHRATEAFFRDQNYFGLHAAQITLFEQGVMPSFDMRTGRVLLAARDEPAVNPNGHGGALRALHTSGALEDLRRRGVEHISYVQIDNPLVRAIDPVFIGLHVAAPDSSREMSSKMIAKRDAAEKVGVFCRSQGRVQVVEYSDLPEELARQTDDSGALRFLAGSPAIHMLGVDFVERLNERAGATGSMLPFHRAEKMVPHIDIETGARVEPDAPNAVKLEMFVFDALPECESSIILETDRVDEFAPIKNADGADSPASSARLQTERAARWLEQAGVEIPRRADRAPDCTFEIGPLAAMTPDELNRPAIRPKLPTRIEPGASFAL